MDQVEALLHEGEDAILDDATAAVVGLEHYRRDGGGAARERLQALYRELVLALRTRDLSDLRHHAARVARERLEAGFELAELHSAFSALNHAIARQAGARLGPTERAWFVALVATALSHARGALERTYATLDPRSGPRSAVDLTPLFSGVEFAPQARADDLVFPV